MLINQLHAMQSNGWLCWKNKCICDMHMCIIQVMDSANERKYYYVTPSVIAWSHTQNNLW